MKEKYLATTNAKNLGIKWEVFKINWIFDCDMAYLFDEYLKIGKIVKLLSYDIKKTGDPDILFEYRICDKTVVRGEVLLDSGDTFLIEKVYHKGVSLVVYDCEGNVIAGYHDLVESDKLKKFNRHKRIKDMLRK